MKSTQLVLIILLQLAFFACSKEKTELIDNAPQLEITVVDISHSPVADAAVSLFVNEADWKAQTNSIAETTTNDNGQALFQELEAEVYYFYAQKGEMTNQKSTSLIDTPLAINVKATIQTTIK